MVRIFTGYQNLICAFWGLGLVVCHWFALWQTAWQMEDIITMDKFGRLVLPRSIRKALHLRPPAAFRAEVVGNHLELTPLPAKSGAVFKTRKGLLVVSSGAEKFDAGEAIRAMRDERL
jgi:bifunctional DNA-binding transcriptional regulator/antitoxin component of YhaV-PrlF toxin-antitoxin module